MPSFVRFCCLCVCICPDGRTDGRTWVSLAPHLLDEIYSWSAFNSSFFTGRCPMNVNILAPQNRALQTGCKKHNGDFLELDQISPNHVHRLPERYLSGKWRSKREILVLFTPALSVPRISLLFGIQLATIVYRTKSIFPKVT
jgi:hypothetical protein